MNIPGTDEGYGTGTTAAVLRTLVAKMRRQL